MCSGDNLDVLVLPSHTLRGFQRTSPSTAFLLPSRYFWDENEVLVSCPGKGNYTVKDYERFFNDMGYPSGWEMRRDTENLLGKVEAPGVEVHCLHGLGVSTVDK
jgi:lysophospholipase-3